MYKLYDVVMWCEPLTYTDHPEVIMHGTVRSVNLRTGTMDIGWENNRTTTNVLSEKRICKICTRTDLV
jgi:hypothetical protein